MSILYAGAFDVKMEKNGRISLPSDFISQEDNRLLLLPGEEAVLFGYTESVWRDAFAKLLNRPHVTPGIRLERRQIFSKGVVVDIVSQGRIIIPKVLRTRFQVDADVTNLTFVGAGGHFEIWLTKEWLEYAKQFD